MNERTKGGFFKKYWFYIAAALLPLAIVLVRCAVYQKWFFGTGDLLRGDLIAQLVPFYIDFWNMIHVKGFSFYTWNLAGGMDTLSYVGYLLSPFSLLVIIAPKQLIPDMVQLVILLKWSCVSLGMTYFFYNTRLNTLQFHKKSVSLFLGTALALSNSMVNFVGYPQLNDVMICFPFLLLLLERMVTDKKWKLYFIVLAYCMINNLYMTFGLCIVLLFWYCLMVIIDDNAKKSFTIFVGSSCLAAVNAAIAVVPGFLVLGDRVNIDSNSGNDIYIRALLISFVQFIKQFFIFNSLSRPTETDPNVYFSIMGIVLIILFAFINLNKRLKQYLAGFELFITASFFIGFLSLIWHCFTSPNGVYHRFSNYFVFFALVMVLEVLIHLEDIQKKHVLIAFAIELAIVLLTFFGINVYGSVLIYLVTILLLVFYFILLFLYTQKSIAYSNMLMVIVSFGIIELCVNCFNSFGQYTTDYAFKDTVSILQDMTDDIVLEKGQRISGAQYSNIGMITDRPSQDGFISGINGNMRNLFENLGLPYGGRVSFGLTGASPVISLLFNTSYYIASDDIGISDSERLNDSDGMELYKTNRLAGLGYMVTDNIVQWDVNNGTTCFDLQNDFINYSIGGENIFEEVLPDVTCSSTLGDNVDIDQETFDEGHVYYYTYTHRSNGLKDFLCAEFEVTEDMDLYSYVFSGNPAYLSVYIDDVQIHLDSALFQQQTLHIGKVKRGQKVLIAAVDKYNDVGEDQSLFMYFAKYNEEAFAKAYEVLSHDTFTIDAMDNDRVAGEIDAPYDGVMMTSIQASENMKVYVDGKESDYVAVGGAMIGVPLTAGIHAIEFIYRPVKTFIGYGIALLSWIAFIIICIVSKRKSGSVNED